MGYLHSRKVRSGPLRSFALSSERWLPAPAGTVSAHVRLSIQQP